MIVMWLKLRGGTGMCCGGTCTWRWTLAPWQPKQAFTQAVTSEERPFQTYLEEIRWRVARLPGWWSHGDVRKPVAEGLWVPPGGMCQWKSLQ